MWARPRAPPLPSTSDTVVDCATFRGSCDCHAGCTELQRRVERERSAAPGKLRLLELYCARHKGLTKPTIAYCAFSLHCPLLWTRVQLPLKYLRPSVRARRSRLSHRASKALTLLPRIARRANCARCGAREVIDPLAARLVSPTARSGPNTTCGRRFGATSMTARCETSRQRVRSFCSPVSPSRESSPKSCSDLPRRPPPAWMRQRCSAVSTGSPTASRSCTRSIPAGSLQRPTPWRHLDCMADSSSASVTRSRRTSRSGRRPSRLSKSICCATARSSIAVTRRTCWTDRYRHCATWSNCSRAIQRNRCWPPARSSPPERSRAHFRLLQGKPGRPFCTAWGYLHFDCDLRRTYLKIAVRPDFSAAVLGVPLVHEETPTRLLKNYCAG